MSDALDRNELRDSIAGVLQQRAPTCVAIPDEAGRGLDSGLWQEMAALGWLGLAINKAHGGLGLGMAHLAVLYEQLGATLASVPLLPTMMTAQALQSCASPAVQQKYLPAIAQGQCIAATLWDGDMEMDAQRNISGTAPLVLFAAQAQQLLVRVQSAQGAALALIAADSAGVTIDAAPLFDLTRPAAQVHFAQVAVAAEHLWPCDAAQIAALTDHAAVALACESIGASDALFARTLDYLKIRQQFGRAIGSFQALKHRAADWKAQLEAVRALARHSAALLDTDAPNASALASEAKAYACDVFAEFAGDAVQLHGGIGFTWEHECHLFLKRAKLNQQIFATSRAHRDRAAALLFTHSATV